MTQVKFSATNKPQKLRLQDCSLDQNSVSRDFKFGFCIFFFFNSGRKKGILGIYVKSNVRYLSSQLRIILQRKNFRDPCDTWKFQILHLRRPFPTSTCEVLLLPLSLVTEVATSKLEQWEQMFSYAVSGWETTKHVWGDLTDCVGIRPGLTGDEALLWYVCVEIGRTLVVFPPFPPNVCGSGVA